MTKHRKIILYTQNISVSFSNQVVLHDVNLEFTEKSITVLVGKSGSGKTTFLRSLNRLNDEFESSKTSGHIAVDFGQGMQSIYGPKQSKYINLQTLRQNMGMVFQTPQILPVSIYRNLAMPLQLVANTPTQHIRPKVEQMLHVVGLWDEVKDRLERPAEILSGGQQQRLCLARTLALEPKILLLDEPTSSLDNQATQQIEALLLQLKSKYTIIMVSHNLEQTQRLADTIVTFEAGRVINTQHF